MYRRRRPPAREPVFGFDCFLDVVTNVVGIIIRLILVAWVGARAYSGIVELDDDDPPQTEYTAPKPGDHPLHAQLAAAERELAATRAKLLDQLKHLERIKEKKDLATRHWQALSAERQDLARRQQELAAAWGPKPGHDTGLDLSLAELQRRLRDAAEQIRTLEKLPPVGKTLRYHGPVSRPVQADELMFECKAGRVTFIDLAAFVAEIRRGLDAKGELLRSQWKAEDIAGPYGAFRMRYTIERERELLESIGEVRPRGESTFRYGLSEWVLEPVAAHRGETLEQALAAGSEFRQLTDTLQPKQAVVTFWVYPDSFALFRRLRDELYERGAEVAGRPLPDTAPIAASRHGTASRGQ